MNLFDNCRLLEKGALLVFVYGLGYIRAEFRTVFLLGVLVATLRYLLLSSHLFSSTIPLNYPLCNRNSNQSTHFLFRILKTKNPYLLLNIYVKNPQSTIRQISGFRLSESFLRKTLERKYKKIIGIPIDVLLAHISLCFSVSKPLSLTSFLFGDINHEIPLGMLRLSLIEGKKFNVIETFVSITLESTNSKVRTYTSPPLNKWKYTYDWSICHPQNIQWINIDIYERENYLDSFKLSFEDNMDSGYIKDIWKDTKFGSLHVQLSWFKLSEIHEASKDNVSTKKILFVFIDSLLHLPSSNESSKVLLECCNEIQETDFVLKSQNPIFRKGFTFRIDRLEKLRILVVNDKQSVLGKLTLSLETSIPASKTYFLQHPHNEKSYLDSCIVLSFVIQKLETPLRRQVHLESLEHDEKDNNNNMCETLTGNSVQLSLSLDKNIISLIVHQIKSLEPFEYAGIKMTLLSKVNEKIKNKRKTSLRKNGVFEEHFEYVVKVEEYKTLDLEVLFIIRHRGLLERNRNVGRTVIDLSCLDFQRQYNQCWYTLENISK